MPTFDLSLLVPLIAAHFLSDFALQGNRMAKSKGRPAGYSQVRTELALYDLKSDPGESNNVADEHPEVVARLEQMAEEAREKFGDRLTQRNGSAVRGPGRVD